MRRKGDHEMRNRRGAWGALLLAGAAYAWRNRDKLSQQFNSMRRQYGGTQSGAARPSELPDLSPTEQRDFNTRPTTTYNERELGGTNL